MTVELQPQDVDTSEWLKVATREDALRAIDRLARFTLKISGEEFLEGWDHGEYADRLDEPRIFALEGYVLMLRDE